MVSLGIITRRLKNYLGKFLPGSCVGVPFEELYLDTQTLFLFVQQYLEDIALVVKFFSPKYEDAQLPSTFRKLFKYLRTHLPADNPLRRFLDSEANLLNEIRDIRDDILHRTDFGKKRGAQFPEFIEVIRSAGGVARFASGPDLLCYVRTVLDKIIACACLTSSFLMGQMKTSDQGVYLDMPGFVGTKELFSSIKPEAGMSFLQLGTESWEALDHFLPLEKADETKSKE